MGRWVQAVTGARSPLDIAVMSHFIWQVKRKLNGMPVIHHMMPVIVGKTGAGKTLAIRKFLAPVYEVCNAPESMRALEDSREMALFTRFYVLEFDEMSKSSQVDVGILKHKLSSDLVSYRILGTHRHVVSPNNATFIGSSNDSIVDLVYDPTSARRFWEIKASDRLDWDATDQIDYLALWQGVDEAAASPIIPYLDQITQVQSTELRNKDSVELFLEELCEATDEAGTTASTVYMRYREFCEAEGIKSPVTHSRFGRLARNHGWATYRTASSVMYRLKLKSSHHPMATLLAFKTNKSDS